MTLAKRPEPMLSSNLTQASLAQRHRASEAAAAIKPWYAVLTEPAREQKALHALERYTLNVLFPCFLKHRRDILGRSRGLVVKPLLPAYVFIQLTNPSDWPRINATSYCRSIITIPSGKSEYRVPFAVPAKLIRQLLTTADAEAELNKRSSRHPSLPAPTIISGNTIVTILSGPMAGQYGICKLDDGKRTKVMMTVFDRQVPIEFSRQDVKPT